MKHMGRIMMIVLALLLLLSCMGCSQLLDAVEDEELRGYTEAMLDAIVENDLDAGYALIDDVCTKAEFRSLLTALRQLFGNADTYELEPLAIYRNRSIQDGETVDSVQASYMMTVGTERYVIDVATHSTCENLAAFYVTPYEKTDYYRTGELGAMEGANALQWVMLLSNLISIALVVFALIDACRRKIQRKPLWIVLILLALVTVGITLGATRLNFNFNLAWLLGYSALILYGGGTTVFRVMLPLGAILYFILRKQLVVKPAPEVVGEPIPEEQAPPPSEPEWGSNQNGTDAE
ncbi:MAG: hypothetical protein E7663_06785 [Ruminococcaceae bacterium]|nr:hypothetical protein [Oscillospiraceae bacterium]